MIRTASFQWGLLGAVLPEVVRFFRIVSAGQPLPHLQWLFYGAILLTYSAAAGFVAIAWRPDAEWKALWVGASLPALVGALVQAAPSLPNS